MNKNIESTGDLRMEDGMLQLETLQSVSFEQQINTIQHLSADNALGLLKSMYKSGGQWQSRNEMSSTLDNRIYQGLSQRMFQLAGYDLICDGYIGPKTLQIGRAYMKDRNIPRSQSDKGWPGPKIFEDFERFVENKQLVATTSMNKLDKKIDRKAKLNKLQGNIKPESVSVIEKKNVAGIKNTLNASGYLLRSSGKQFNETGDDRASNRTSINGLRYSTVDGMKHMMTWLNLSYPGSKLVITGLAETSIHASGDYSHGNGYKADISVYQSAASARNLITLTGVKKGGPRMYWKIPGNPPFGDKEQWIGVRREPKHVDKYGNVQRDHLDIVFYPPGYVLQKDKNGRPIEYDEQENIRQSDDGIESEVPISSLEDVPNIYFEQKQPGVKFLLDRKKSPITTKDVVLASLKYPQIKISWLMAIMAGDSQLGTEGAGAKLNNPGNVGHGDDDLFTFGSWREGVEACAKNIARRVDAFEKRYPNQTPTVKHLITNSGPDGKGFFKSRIGKKNPTRDMSGSLKYEGYYMQDQSAYTRIPGMVEDYENNKGVMEDIVYTIDEYQDDGSYV